MELHLIAACILGVRRGRDRDGVEMVSPYLAYMRMLAAVTVDP